MKRTPNRVDIHLVVPKPLAAAIDKWRLDHQHLGSRPDAIRKILQLTLIDNATGKKAA